jgi:riboflavin synthase
VFTGLIEDVGTVRSRAAHGPSVKLSIATRLGPLDLGESVAVHGVCLTVTRFQGGVFDADCSAETLARSSLGRMQAGSRVHLERALAVGARLGGHFVSGHVDGLAEVAARRSVGDALEVSFRTDVALSRFYAEKGSIALDGVSLTVNRIEGTTFQVMLVPHTLAHTTLGDLAVGDRVNVEIDTLARYVARLLETRDGPHQDAPSGGSTDPDLINKLRGSGYL